MKSIQKNDFKCQMVSLLNKNNQENLLLPYLEAQEKSEVLEVLAMISDKEKFDLQSLVKALFPVKTQENQQSGQNPEAPQNP